MQRKDMGQWLREDMIPRWLFGEIEGLYFMAGEEMQLLGA